MPTITIFDVTHPLVLPVCFIFLFGAMGAYNVYSLLMLSHRNRLRKKAEKLIKEGHNALLDGEKPITLEDGSELSCNTAKKILKQNKEELRKISGKSKQKEQSKSKIRKKSGEENGKHQEA